MPGYSPAAIANQFIDRTRGKGLTQMQLQKLVYIAHAWNLAIFNEALVDAQLEAWDRGPVYPDLRRQVAHAGIDPICELIRENDHDAVSFLIERDRGQVISCDLSEDEKKLIDWVYKHYGELTGNHLSNLTHQQGTPWYQVYHSEGRNAKIEDDQIKSYYDELKET